MRAAHLSGELLFLQPTRDAAAVAAAMAAALAAHGGGAWTQRVLRRGQGWQAAEDEQLTFELLSPSHGATWSLTTITSLHPTLTLTLTLTLTHD